MQLQHGSDGRSNGTWTEWLTRAGERVRTRAALLCGASLAAAIAVSMAGLSFWFAIAGIVLAICLGALVELENEERPSPRSAGSIRGGIDSAPQADWHMVLNAIPDPVLTLGNGGRIVHFNPAAREIYATLRIGGQAALLSRDPDFLQAIDEVVDDGFQRTIEVQERVPIDRRVRITLTAMPERVRATTSREAAPHVVIVLRDLTEQDRLAKMRADFVANASHELRTPLASVVGFIETLQGRASDDPVARARFLGIMSEQAARMQRLVEDLLSLSRVEMREHVPPRTAIDLNETVTAAIQALEPVAQRTGSTLSLSLCDGPAMVLGETDEIVQVVQNLVQNGIKYGRPGGPIEVTVRRIRQGPTMRLAVAVRDEGPGIPPEHLPRLTERFYRVSAKSSREKGGTGLGLAIVKHIANRHRGELRVTSELGKGSTFTFVVDEQILRPGHAASR